MQKEEPKGLEEEGLKRRGEQQNKLVEEEQKEKKGIDEIMVESGMVLPEMLSHVLFGLQKTNKTLQKENADLKKQVVHVTKERDDIYKEHRIVTEQVEKLASQTEELKQRVDILFERENTLAKANELLSSENKLLKMELSELRNEVENIKRVHNEEINELKFLHEMEMIEKGADIETLEATINQLEKKDESKSQFLSTTIKSKKSLEKIRDALLLRAVAFEAQRKLLKLVFEQIDQEDKHDLTAAESLGELLKLIDSIEDETARNIYRQLVSSTIKNELNLKQNPWIVITTIKRMKKQGTEEVHEAVSKNKLDKAKLLVEGMLSNKKHQTIAYSIITWLEDRLI